MIIKVMAFIGMIALVGAGTRWIAGTHREYVSQVNKGFEVMRVGGSDTVKPEVIAEEDLEGLPDPLKRYMKYAGVIGKERVSHFKLVFEGEMRMDEKKEWAPVSAEQYTFAESGTRLFYITMDYNHIPIHGLHHYNESDASMVIKVLDLIKVVDNRGEVMHKAETVTYFNDICLFAPAALLDADISWEALDDRSVKGKLKLHGNEVSAILFFRS